MLRIYELDKLSECFDHAKVDSVLDELGVEENIDQRVLILHQHMGISQSFTSTDDAWDITPEEEYAFAKQQLALMNKRRMGKEPVRS